jgi:hypothetical protein
MKAMIIAPDGVVLAAALEAECLVLNRRETVGLSVDWPGMVTIHGYGKYGANLTPELARDLGETLLEFADTGRLVTAESI